MSVGATSPHAARLRRDATDVEKRLWAALQNRQLGGFKFRRQATIGPFVVDFLCAEFRLIIELDGGQHSPETDRPRTAFLESAGYEILRFWNNEFLENFEEILAVILARLEGWPKKADHPHPTLSRQRERARGRATIKLKALLIGPIMPLPKRATALFVRTNWVVAPQVSQKWICAFGSAFGAAIASGRAFDAHFGRVEIAPGALDLLHRVQLHSLI